MEVKTLTFDYLYFNYNKDSNENQYLIIRIQISFYIRDHSMAY